jgi:hypothetical protein
MASIRRFTSGLLGISAIAPGSVDNRRDIADNRLDFNLKRAFGDGRLLWYDSPMPSSDACFALAMTKRLR